MKSVKNLLLAFGIAILIHADATAFQEKSLSTEDLTVVVMDPLCDKLACDCVEGYAQRKYEVVGKFLKKKLGRDVQVFWGESVQTALEDRKQKHADIVIGKHSVVESDAESLKWKLLPVAQLTSADGSVTQTGLIVVRRNDPATRVADLKEYRIFFGPDDCDEKYKAPIRLLQENGIKIPARPEVSGACSEAATKLMQLDEDIQAAAVISSYAEPLLSGCGTIEKGDLRIIGVSDEVPFVTAFVNVDLPKDLRRKIKSALLETAEDAAVLEALQSAGGFVEYESDKSRKRASERRDNNASSSQTQTTKKN